MCDGRIQRTRGAAASGMAGGRRRALAWSEGRFAPLQYRYLSTTWRLWCGAGEATDAKRSVFWKLPRFRGLALTSHGTSFLLQHPDNQGSISSRLLLRESQRTWMNRRPRRGFCGRCGIGAVSTYLLPLRCMFSSLSLRFPSSVHALTCETFHQTPYTPLNILCPYYSYLNIIRSVN